MYFETSYSKSVFFFCKFNERAAIERVVGLNANDIKWITSGNLEHDPFFFSIPEKLDTFGYCIDFTGYGEGKADKAQLCILDVANKKNDPNILIICPDGSKESWYVSLLKGVGLDFKFVNAAHDAVTYFSANTSNLLLLDEKVLAEGDGSAFAPIKNSGLTWDLIIIDGSGAVDGMNYSLYTDNIGMKTLKLLIFAPYPAEYTTAPDNIGSIVKALLNDDNMAKGVDDYKIDENVMKFTMETPFVNYPRELNTVNKVNIVRYQFPEADIPANLHIEEQAGSRYSHGGNVFEEYNLPEQSVYRKHEYTRSDAETLRNKDKKLAKFLEIIDGIMSSEDRTAVVYFKSEATVDYIEKMLSAIYSDQTAFIIYLDKTRADTRMLKQWYEVKRGRRFKVILASDRMSESIGTYTPITDIINYELPDSPVELQQRYMRRSLDTSVTDPVFTVFLDDNGLFDSRVMSRALAGNLYKAFRVNVPCDNIMFNVEGIENMLTDVIADIKYVADYTGAVGSSFDVISKFRQDYNVPSSRGLTTAPKTHDYAQHKLETIAKALGVSDMIKEKDLDKAALTSKITAKINEIRSGFAFFDKDGEIKAVPYGTSNTAEFKQFAGYLDGNPFNLGLKNAQEELEKAVKGKNEYAYIKDAVSQISDTLKPAVLYNIWIYWHKTLGIGGSYAEFIKAYNEGVI